MRIERDEFYWQISSISFLMIDSELVMEHLETSESV